MRWEGDALSNETILIALPLYPASRNFKTSHLLAFLELQPLCLRHR